MSRPRRPGPAAPILALVAAALALAGCAGPAPAAPAGLFPPDLDDPAAARLHERDGLRVWAARDCLGEREAAALLDELLRARAEVALWLGPALAPGDFRPRGEARGLPDPACSPDAIAPIDVVVTARGGRCHADGEGITVVKDHLDRRDATHELVHYLSGSSWRPLDEGLAVYLTERLWGPDRDVPVKIRARVFRDLGLAKNLYPPDMRDGMSRRDYDVAGAFVGWLIEAYGKDRFFELYAGAVRNYHPVYGIGELELWERFWRYTGNLDVRHDAAYHRYKARVAD